MFAGQNIIEQPADQARSFQPAEQARPSESSSLLLFGRENLPTHARFQQSLGGRTPQPPMLPDEQQQKGCLLMSIGPLKEWLFKGADETSFAEYEASSSNALPIGK